MAAVDSLGTRRNLSFIVMGGLVLAAIGMVVWTGAGRSGTSDTTQPASFSDLAAQGDAAGYNVLLVTLDTTRPDYLGCYGRE
ncbi:MAG: hypothetical protein GY842_28495, partial [bacterium]|nr:hypothetical protein [bacterium]